VRSRLVIDDWCPVRSRLVIDNWVSIIKH
jgi:hypothetical protein